MKNQPLIQLFFSIFILLSNHSLNAQQKDSVYYIKFVSSEDGKGLEFTNLIINETAKKVSDVEGIIKIKESELRGAKNKIELSASKIEFETLYFMADKLQLNKTVIVQLKKKPIEFETIEIVSYKIPVIERDPDKHFSKREKQKIKEAMSKKDTAICYSEKEVMDYAKVLRNNWQVDDSLKSKSIYEPNAWYNYIRQHLIYPKRAYDNEVQEKIFVDFELDQTGHLTNIRLAKGNSPVLSVYLVDFLYKMPALNIYRSYNDNKSSQPTEYRLSVSFRLL